ncbi:hypothetical protein GCM10011401_09630 [Nesterenkonia cremea]|uniref:Uncharacterized protein n=1 Tax=Nesterenkonia cremea TaxID=1882340 RepID=A0A917EQ37_9MICC|nr:hypothetical protein GCM10011401_09630 [Nesterenkonia cremea]
MLSPQRSQPVGEDCSDRQQGRGQGQQRDQQAQAHCGEPHHLLQLLEAAAPQAREALGGHGADGPDSGERIGGGRGQGSAAQDEQRTRAQCERRESDVLFPATEFLKHAFDAI